MNEHQVTSMIFVKNKINNYNLSKIYYNITLKVCASLISYISSQNFLMQSPFTKKIIIVIIKKTE
jgi:hypothetical protein